MGIASYVQSPKGKLYALDAKTGDKIWVQDLLRKFGSEIPGWGFAASTLIEGDLLLLPVGGTGDQFMAAFDKHSDEVAHISDGGLMGLTLDPQFASRLHLYATYMYKPDPQEKGLFIKVVRLRHLGSTCEFDRILLDHIPGASVHIGGRVAFGPDGFLYVGTGDLWQQPISQDLNSLAGKILRITGDG